VYGWSCRNERQPVAKELTNPCAYGFLWIFHYEPSKQISLQSASKGGIVSGGFDITSGIAYSTVLVLDTNYLSAVGDGAINLKTEALDISFKPSPNEGICVNGIGKISLSVPVDENRIPVHAGWRLT
jgi:hypothetical protein